MSDVRKRRDEFLTACQQELDTQEVSRKKNEALVCGVIETEFQYSHQYREQKFYKTTIRCERFSGEADTLQLLVAKSLIGKDTKGFAGKCALVSGQFLSSNFKGTDEKSHLRLFLQAEDITFLEEKQSRKNNSDLIYLEGYICKAPLLRNTGRGSDITDLLLAVNVSPHKSVYIPCIAWYENAIRTSKYEVGTRVKLYGRIQSRKYFKRYEDGSDRGKMKETYEVSIDKISKCKKI